MPHIWSYESNPLSNPNPFLSHMFEKIPWVEKPFFCNIWVRVGIFFGKTFTVDSSIGWDTLWMAGSIPVSIVMCDAGVKGIGAYACSKITLSLAKLSRIGELLILLFRYTPNASFLRVSRDIKIIFGWESGSLEHENVAKRKSWKEKTISIFKDSFGMFIISLFCQNFLWRIITAQDIKDSLEGEREDQLG